MVNLENYTKVVVADTQTEAFSKYITLLGIDEPEDDKDEDVKYIDKKVKVKEINYIVIEGNTVVYIKTENGPIYKTSFTEDLITLESGMTVTVRYNEKFDNSDIISASEVIK